jgi:hypothetical protein
VRTTTKAISLAGILFISGCATVGEREPVSQDVTTTGVALFYVEKEPGLEASNVSMFVNENFIRIDDQTVPNDFILFDRKKRTIYNVISADKTVYAITSRPVTVVSPVTIEYTEEKQESAVMQGAQAEAKSYHYKFSANGKPCYNVVVAENFLPDVVAAMKEFREVLAGEHARSIGNVPPEQLDACDLGLNIFHATRHLDHGFPVREWDASGYTKFLRELQRHATIDPAALELPAAYKVQSFGTK